MLLPCTIEKISRQGRSIPPGGSYSGSTLNRRFNILLEERKARQDYQLNQYSSDWILGYWSNFGGKSSTLLSSFSF